LSVIDDDVIPEEFQSRATSYNNIGFFILKLKNITCKSYFKKGLDQKTSIQNLCLCYVIG
jgi:hypothetical protein